MNRPMFLRGPRRYLVQWDINAVEALGAIVLIAFVVVIGLAMAMKTPHLPLRPCDAPDDGQVLIWYTQNGTPVCQYVRCAGRWPGADLVHPERHACVPVRGPVTMKSPLYILTTRPYWGVAHATCIYEIRDPRTRKIVRSQISPPSEQDCIDAVRNYRAPTGITSAVPVGGV